VKGLCVGRIVHYVVQGGEFPGAEKAAGRHLAALVVAVWTEACINALLLPDGSNDGVPAAGTGSAVSCIWLTSIVEGEGPGTWHKVERS